ncbi:MAG: CDP-alcohol phosphatidyltransferase family protein [Calditrichaeota bacterium]|nr:MAG: CDP-alcohol phosphatidyltransferase family protein [Calditrichota bacterium]
MSHKPFTILPHSVRDGFSKTIEYSVRYFSALRLHPNVFTVMGFVLTCLGAYSYTTQHLVLGGILVILGGICDTIDGKLARQTGQQSKFGAVFDSSMDRYGELAMFFGLGIYFVEKGGYQFTLIATFLALCGSMLVSYVRARAEGLGYECKVGMMQRAERVVLIGFGSILGAYTHEYVLIGVIWIVAIFANITAIQRLHHVWKLERAELKASHSLEE